MSAIVMKMDTNVAVITTKNSKTILFLCVKPIIVLTFSCILFTIKLGGIMTIKEIKDLTKFLTDEDVDKIKNEIKSKEGVLKSQDMDEKEMTQVLNTLFAILVIEKSLETEIEGIEEIREELEKELMESYEIYDAHMAKYKNEEKKKKKKRWLLDFLLISDRVHSKKEGIGASNKMIASLQKELNTLKQQKSNENLKNAINDRDGDLYKEFCDIPGRCNDPRHRHHDHNHPEIDSRRADMRQAMEDRMRERGRNTPPRERSGVSSRENVSRTLDIGPSDYPKEENRAMKAVENQLKKEEYKKTDNPKSQDGPTPQSRGM